jgi:hypothetical protein
MKDEAEIYCPSCTWRPVAEDRWQCLPECGTVWNTFWTRGMCPGCGHLWLQTQCFSCHAVSPHEAWYHYPDDPAEQDRTEDPEVERA